MKISHTKLFCSVFVRIELIGTQHYYNLKMSLRFDIIIHTVCQRKPLIFEPKMVDLELQ